MIFDAAPVYPLSTARAHIPQVRSAFTDRCAAGFGSHADRDAEREDRGRGMSSKLEAWCAKAARKVDDLVRGLDDPDEPATLTSPFTRDFAEMARRFDEMRSPDERARAKAKGRSTRADMAG